MSSMPLRYTGRRVCGVCRSCSRMRSQSSSRSMPAMSWRGIMMSSTVMRSRSMMPSSICWWLRGIITPASATTVRSSSRDSVVCWVRRSTVTPMRRSAPLVTQEMAKTSGRSNHCSPVYTKDEVVASRRGCSAP